MPLNRTKEEEETTARKCPTLHSSAASCGTVPAETQSTDQHAISYPCNLIFEKLCASVASSCSHFNTPGHLGAPMLRPENLPPTNRPIGRLLPLSAANLLMDLLRARRPGPFQRIPTAPLQTVGDLGGNASAMGSAPHSQSHSDLLPPPILAALCCLYPSCPWKKKKGLKKKEQRG